MSENIWFTLSAILNVFQLLMYFFITTFWKECGRRWKRDNKENQDRIDELVEALEVGSEYMENVADDRAEYSCEEKDEMEAKIKAVLAKAKELNNKTT